MNVTIWHHPRCSKSRQTLALLDEQGIMPTIRIYQADPPTVEELGEVQRMLGLQAIDIVRSGEKIFRELGLSETSGDQTLIAAMAQHPILIERPIVICNGKAAIGRPPENVLSLL